MIKELFSNLGRRVPTSGMRVYNEIPSEYYKLRQPKINYDIINNRLKKHHLVSEEFSALDFEKNAEKVLNNIKKNSQFSNLLNGVHIPFAYYGKDDITDLGGNIESKLLPCLRKEFNSFYPNSHFKAVLQSNTQLLRNIKIAENSRYETLIEKTKTKHIVGWFFPQALQEFDVDSQRSQMQSLPTLDGAELCLSGAIDICASLVGSPDLLISEDFYTPILCMSAYQHVDPRMVLLLKAYGPHLEFWCMTQMLSSTVKQVSEQWSGGLCIYN
jgi:hypothetical protein